jgi:hypothetical protein
MALHAAQYTDLPAQQRLLEISVASKYEDSI